MENFPQSDQPVVSLRFIYYTVPMDDSELLSIMSAKLTPARRGRKPAEPFTTGTPRELTEADLATLIHPTSVNATTPIIQRLRSTHHRLAQLIADGTKQVDVSLITGYSQSRISVLMADPGFQELVAQYRNQQEAVYINVHERLANLCTVATEILQERLEDDPDGVSVRELLEVVSETGDRSVAPKKNISKIDQNVTFSWADMVEKSIKLIKEEAAPAPITIENAAE